jgi:hypothetical protein
MKTLYLLITLALSLNVQAAARCVNTTGAVVGYADIAASCPAGSRFQGEVSAMPPAAASDVKNAQAQALRDQAAATAIDTQQNQQARAQAKAQLAAQKQNNASVKRCKLAELALTRAKNRYEDAPSTTFKQAKANKKSKTQTHIVIRESDSKASKSQKKARHALEAAQGKRDLACS